MNPTSMDAMPPPPRRTARLVRRIVDAVLLALAVAGLLMFIGAPMVSGPRPWPVEKTATTRLAVPSPATVAAEPRAPAEARRENANP